MPVRKQARTYRITPYKETHQLGSIAIDNIDIIRNLMHIQDNDFGIQIASDGRVWVCVNGQSIIRFRPSLSSTEED